MIKITNLHVTIDDKPILKGFSLTVAPGEIHALMGKNGAGKSTLARVLAGDPTYEVQEGQVWFQGQNILELAPEERARLGLFMSFQYPLEISGITNVEFLHAAYNAVRGAISQEEFLKILDEKMELLEIKSEFKERNLNEGFSGGEKKRNEILQMALLQPSLAILDETDSGLDIDAMRIVASGVNKLMSDKNGLIIITHYQRLLDYIKPDFVHIVDEGRISFSGGPELALKLEEKGYEIFS